MFFLGVLIVSSCRTADKKDSKSPPVTFPPQESYYETNPVDPETELINASNGCVARTSPDTLQITLGNGKKVALKDYRVHTDYDDQVKYIYAGLDKNSDCHLIDLQLYEAYGVLAINAKDGTQTHLPGLPIYNPSQNMFVLWRRGPYPEHYNRNL